MSRKKRIACLLALAGGIASVASIRAFHRPAKHPTAASISPFAARRTASSFSFPVTFEPNLGQAASGAQFIGRGRELSAFLVRGGIDLAISPRRGADGGASASAANSNVEVRLMQVKARYGHTTAAFHWRGNEMLRAESNYLLGNDRRRWRTHVPHYAGAIAESVLPGVGMKVYGNGGGVEYDLRLDPGVDPAGLRFELRGARSARVDGEGDLIARVGENELRVKRPNIYEESPQRKRVDGGYVIEADGLIGTSVGFSIGPHDARLPLIIDPTLTVTYSTFLGGAGAESASSVGLDAAGNIYVSGTTTSPATFPEPFSTTIGPGISSTPGSTNTEYFIAKINPNVSGLNSLEYLTFLGGSGSQSGGLITVDPSGNVAITGTTTSPDFPVTDGSVLTSGANDISVSEIDPTGSTLLFSTLFGGSGAESQYAAGGIAFDSQDLIYIASDTTSQDLPVTSGVFQPTFTGSISDGFLAVFEPGATPDLIYCSYLGANSSAQVGVGGVAVDTSPAVYIAGFTSNDILAFPVKNAFQMSYGGDPSDAFLMKITPTGQGAADVVYATLLGGSGLDEALAVAVDTSIPPNAYVTGTTQSTNFPTNGITAAYQPKLHVSAAANAFLSVIALNPTTGVTSLAYSTYLGGSESDSGQSVVATAFNSVYIAGTAGSWNFPWYENLQPFNGSSGGSSGGSSDAFVAKLDPSAGGTASLLYATPLGGTAPAGLTVSAAATALAADLFGDVSVVGRTTAADFPTAVTTGGVLNGFQPICGSCQAQPSATDAFLVALTESASQRPSVYFNVGSVIFPASPIGTQNSPQPVALHNGGSSSLSISALQITGPNASDFSLIGAGACEGQTVPVGSQCSFEVGFVPSTTGPEAAVVSFTDNAPGNPQVLELIGAGEGPFALLSTTSVNFGSQPENTSSLGIFTITNTGNQALTLQSPSETGPDIAQFFLSGKDITCGPSLTAGSTCQIGVIFSPKSIGTFHAQVNLVDNSGGISNSIQAIALTGTGTAPSPVATIAPVALAFGDIVVGSAAGTQTVSISNTGSTPLNLTGVGMAGANASDFAIASSGSTSCPTGSGSLGVGASCTVGLRFAPAASDAPGVKSAIVTIADNASGSPQMATLTGNATPPPTIQVSPASLNFGAQSVGIASPVQAITLLNTGTASLAVNSIGMTGTNASDFAQTNNCPPSLRGGAACTVNVLFTPVAGAVAARSASVSISDNAAGSPQIVALSGSATQPSISIAPTSINFGGQLAGTSSSAQTITIRNNGAGALAFTSIAFSDTADFAFATNSCKGVNTPPGGTCTIQVTFGPACTNGAAARAGTLILTDNSPGTTQSVALSGQATGDFCFAAVPSAAVAPGQTAAYTVVANSATGYRGSVTVSCGSVPSAATCTTPATVTVPSQFSVTVATAASSGALPLGKNGGRGGEKGRERGRETARAPDRRPALPATLAALFCAWLGLLWILKLNSGWREQAMPAARLIGAAALLLAASMAMSSCGGGGATSDPPAVSGTPAGIYTIMLTGTTAATTSNVTLGLTVN